MKLHWLWCVEKRWGMPLKHNSTAEKSQDLRKVVWHMKVRYFVTHERASHQIPFQNSSPSKTHTEQSFGPFFLCLWGPKLANSKLSTHKESEFGALTYVMYVWQDQTLLLLCLIRTPCHASPTMAPVHRPCHATPTVAPCIGHAHSRNLPIIILRLSLSLSNLGVKVLFVRIIWVQWGFLFVFFFSWDLLICETGYSMTTHTNSPFITDDNFSWCLTSCVSYYCKLWQAFFLLKKIIRVNFHHTVTLKKIPYNSYKKNFFIKKIMLQNCHILNNWFQHSKKKVFFFFSQRRI
jgi:hypothetical protein